MTSEWEHLSDEREEMYKDVLDELKELRRRPWGVKSTDMFSAPTLLRLYGQGDPGKARSGLQQYIDLMTFKNLEVQIARQTLFDLMNETVEKRLEEAGKTLGVDARNARIWSDRGLELIALQTVARYNLGEKRTSTDFVVGIHPATSGRLRLRVGVRGIGDRNSQRPQVERRGGKALRMGDATETDAFDDGSWYMGWDVHITLPSLSALQPNTKFDEILVRFDVTHVPAYILRDTSRSRRYEVRIRIDGSYVWIEFWTTSQ